MALEMTERLPFDEVSILEHTPSRATPGVFVLCIGSEPRQGWLLVGHDANVQGALLEILDDPPEGLEDTPEYFMWLAKTDGDRAGYANKLAQFMKLQDM